MSVTIRAAAAGEAHPLTELALRSKAHWGYSPEFLDACRPALTVHGTCTSPTFVAEADGDVVGFYQIIGEVLDALFIDPAWIGRGVGTALLDHAVATARAAGICALTLISDPNAEAFYAAKGWVRIGEVASDVPGFPRMLPQMRRPIAAR